MPRDQPQRMSATMTPFSNGRGASVGRNADAIDTGDGLHWNVILYKPTIRSVAVIATTPREAVQKAWAYVRDQRDDEDEE